MRKKKTIGILVLCLIITCFSISAKNEKKTENERVSKYCKDTRQFGLKEFTNMDLGLIGYFPTKKHFRQISQNIELVPIDSLRYIDSLDINKMADTLYVKVYSQNYAYQSKNVYTIAENKNKSTDTLMIFHIGVDLKMKDIIADAETFRTKDFTVDYIVKQNIANIDKRIVLNKNYR